MENLLQAIHAGRTLILESDGWKTNMEVSKSALYALIAFSLCSILKFSDGNLALCNFLLPVTNEQT
jgi:hypothetical protein